MSVLVKALLRKANVHLASHPFQLKVFVAHCGVFVEHFVELAELEEDDLVEVFAFDTPVLLHCFSEAFRSIRRNVKSRWVIIWLVWPSSFVVTTAMWRSPIRSGISKLLSQSCISHRLIDSHSFDLGFLLWLFGILC